MSRKRVNITMDENQLKKLDKFCRIYGMSRSETIGKAISEYFQEFEYWKRVELQAGEHDLIGFPDIFI